MQQACGTTRRRIERPKVGREIQYLDERQKQWFEWPIAKAAGGPCVSCHTGLPYLLARPHLRKTLGETTKTEFESGLLEGLQTRLASGESMFKSFKKEPLRSQGLCVEAMLSVIALGLHDDALRETGCRLENPLRADLTELFANLRKHFAQIPAQTRRPNRVSNSRRPRLVTCKALLSRSWMTHFRLNAVFRKAAPRAPPT